MYVLPNATNAFAWMSRKKAGMAFAISAESAAAFAAESDAGFVAAAAVGVDDSADWAVATVAVVRASRTPSAADRCRSKGPPGEVGAVRARDRPPVRFDAERVRVRRGL